MRKPTRFLLASSGVIPLIGLLGSPPDTMLLIYSVFILAFLLRPHVTVLMHRVPLHPSIKFPILIIASGWVAECLAWTGHYLAHSEQPALLHPQLIPDLILAIGFYGGWALAWAVVLRYYRFSLISVFTLTGLLGVPVEQSGAVLASMFQALSTNPLAVIWGGYVFVVYGSIMGLAYLPIESELYRPQQRHHWLKYPAALLLMYLGANLLTATVALVATPLGLIPEPRPIWRHPLF